MYMGHIRPIQALHTYIWIPYICWLPSFGCEYALCPLHIPLWHVASFRPTSFEVREHTNTEQRDCWLGHFGVLFSPHVSMH